MDGIVEKIGQQNAVQFGTMQQIKKTWA